MKRRYLEMMSDLGVNTAFEDPPSPLVQTNHSLALKTYRMLANEKANVCFSPITVASTMAMLLCAADRKMKSKMKTAFGYDKTGLKIGEIAPTTKKQMSSFLEHPDFYTFHSASCLLSQKDLQMKERYKQMLTESFEATTLEFDFKTESEKAVKQVNEWVKEETNNSIAEIMDSLDHDTAIALLNAVYFKGTWKVKFKEEEIYPENFYSKTTRVKEVDMMHARNFFYFYEDECFKVLQLPYDGEDLCMLIVLPGRYDLKSVEDSFTSSFLRDMTDKLWGLEVEISLPRFRLECVSHLIPRIQRLGVHLGVEGSAFSRGDEVGGCCCPLLKSPDVAVSDFSHKAVLEVREDGSEAKEATVMRLLSPNPKKPCPPKTFVADHPFLYIIFDPNSELILLMGRVSDL